MQKQHGPAVRALLRLAVAKHARALRFERVAGRADIGNFIADVVDAAFGIALQEFGNRRRVAKRFDQLDLRVWQSDEDRGHAMLRLRHGRRDLGTKRLAINVRSPGNIGHGNGDVVESADHALSSRICWNDARHPIWDKYPSARSLIRYPYQDQTQATARYTSSTWT